MWMKNVNNFQIVKVQPQDNASHLLDFCQFLPGIAYKSVAHKKACITLEFAASKESKPAATQNI